MSVKKCAVCDKVVERKCKKEPITCSKPCWSKLYKKTYQQPKKECAGCKKTRIIQGDGLCPKCYMRNYEYVKKRCSLCNNIDFIRARLGEGFVCRKCHKNPKRLCSVCGEINYINDKTKEICIKCYRKIEVCSVCGKISRIHRKGNVCRKCAPVPLKLCSVCQKYKTISLYTETQALCVICYKAYRIEHDEEFRIRNILSSRLRSAFVNKKYQKKISKEYHIDYKKIVEFLGPCPGKKSNWQIDHILPLVAFNYTKDFEIWASFHPTNHQWLRAEENNKKRAKYNKNDLKIFLLNVKSEWEDINEC